MNSASIQPVAAKERIQLLDILRGFAILGILMVNMPLFNSPIMARIGNFALWHSQANHLADLVIRFFFEGKFYSLFSILFGIGFYLFLQKQNDSGTSILPTFRRRLFYLLLFGVLHITLLWAGDILFFYALFGFVLILFRKKTTRSLKKWILAMILIPIVITGFAVLMVALGKMHPEGAKQIEASFAQQEQYLRNFIEKALETYAHGSFAEIFTTRVTEWRFSLNGIFFFYPNVFAMFLLGFFLAKKGWLFNLKANRSVFRKMLWAGLVLGIIGNSIYTWGMEHSSQMDMNPTTLIAITGFGFGVPAMTLFYIAAFALATEKGIFSWCIRRLAMVGRMALTNYLLQSILCTTIFYSYGFGLYGTVNIWQGIILTFIIYGLQILFSIFWLKRFHYGPFEWLWRSLSYRKIQKFKIRS
ncbi:MAG: DUF418 domain-containing protein [Bacteroidales bacterium]|nr:DUF418 domain-containing protein [Bacteroidales bacterium]